MSAPSGYTALDFVGFTDKGTYSPIVNYMRNDLVHYGGNIMRCLIDNTKNVTPVVGANWELWVGASANLVERVIAPLENNPADVAFGVGRQIIYDDWLWEVIAPIAVGDALIDYAVDPTNANIKKSAPVETQLLAVKAEADATDNMIAPTEANASSSSAPYSVGDQLILNNILYDVIAAIQIGDALTTGTGGNIAAADTLTDQLNAKANSSDLAAVATSGVYSDLSGTPTLGTAAAKDSTNAVTSGSTDLVESGAVYTEIQTLTNEISNTVAYINTNSTTASKNYAKDELFILDGVLRKALVNITAGNTLTINSNYETVGNIGSQLFRFGKIPFTWTPQGQGHKQFVDIVITGLINGSKIVSATIVTGSTNMDATISDINMNHVYGWIYENANTSITSLTGYLLVLYYL